MERRGTTHGDVTPTDRSFNAHDDGYAAERLAWLEAAHAEIAHEKTLFRTERERLEAATMVRPISTEQAFSYFGLMLGALTPAAIFLRFLLETGPTGADVIWIVTLMALVNTGASIGGFFSGKVVARFVRELNRLTVPHSILLLPFLGLLWGMVAGAAGGVFFFVIGAAVGAVLGGAVGAAALPAFALLHRSLKKGEMMELSQYLPVAFGVTLTICSFILGL